MIGWILCKFGRHKYYLLKNMSREVQKISCRRCARVWGMHHGVQALIEWDYELEMLYAEGGFTI